MDKSEYKSSSRKNDRMNQVLDAATCCFVKSGFHGTGMTKISAAADMSVGHIYHYFENKDAIIKAIVQREADNVTAKIEEIQLLEPAEIKPTFLSKIHEGLKQATDPIQTILNNEILAECRRNPEIASIIYSMDKQMRTFLAGLYEEKLGLSHAEERVELMIALFHGMGTRIRKNPDMDIDNMMLFIEPVVNYVLDPANFKDC